MSGGVEKKESGQNSLVKTVEGKVGAETSAVKIKTADSGRVKIMRKKGNIYFLRQDYFFSPYFGVVVEVPSL